MIVNASLKIAVSNAFRTTTLTDNIEILATEIILYKYLVNLTANTSVNNNNITDLVNSYKSQYESKFSTLKNVYVSYNKIYNFLKNNNYTNNLLTIPEAAINTVYELYCDNTLITQFSNITFSNSMYNVTGIGNKVSNYLKRIHYNVMCPIIEYYNKVYNIPIENMKIISSDQIPYNVGKEIIFTINGISPFIILRDIENKTIDIEYYSIKCSYPNIELVNK